MSRLSNALRAFKQQLNIERRIGYLGLGTNGEVHDRSNPGNMWVRYPTAGGGMSAAVSLPVAVNANIPDTDGLAVEVGLRKKKPIILGVSYEGLQGAGVNPIQLNPSDSLNSRLIHQDRITTFYATRHADLDNKPFYAIVLPGWYYDDSGDKQFFPGSEIDLSAFQPAAGDHCYVAVFLKITDGALEAFASTDMDVADPLGVTDIQEAAALKSTGSLDIWAWELRGDDTALTVDPGRAPDIRHLFDGGSSSGGGGTVTTASNVGGGAEWFKDLTATILRFRTFISSHLGLVITQNANDITIDLDESEIDHNSLDNLTVADPHTQYVTKALYDANSILKADSDNTPVALPVAASRIVARLASGGIVDATVAQAKTLLAYIFSDIGGTAAPTQGGTGLTSYTTGDTLYASASNVLSKLAAGTNGFFYKMVAGIPAWAAIAASDIASGILALVRGGTGSDLSGTGPGALVQASSGAAVTVETLAATRGGTGQSTITTGDTLYGSASNVISKLAAGTNGFFYKMVAGIPAWAAIAASDIASGILALARGGTGADLSATGGAGKVLKQSSAGAAITVAVLLDTDIPNISATYIATAIISAKGDLIAGTVSGLPSIRTVGTNGQVLVADSTDPTGLKYAVRATPALDNLASVAINESLISDTDNTDNLGSSAKKWAALFAYLEVLKERTAPSTPSSGDLDVYADTLHNLHKLSSLGMDDIFKAGDYAAAKQSAIGTSEVSMVTKSIPANVLSTKGWIHTSSIATVLNAAGANRTHSHTYNFGAYSMVIAPSTAQATNASSRRVYLLDVWTWNDQAANLQLHIFHYVQRGAAAAETAPAAAADDLWTWGTSTIDTSAGATTVSQTIKSNNASGTQTVYCIGDLDGPNPAT